MEFDFAKAIADLVKEAGLEGAVFVGVDSGGTHVTIHNLGLLETLLAIHRVHVTIDRRIQAIKTADV